MDGTSRSLGGHSHVTNSPKFVSRFRYVVRFKTRAPRRRLGQKLRPNLGFFTTVQIRGNDGRNVSVNYQAYDQPSVYFWQKKIRQSTTELSLLITDQFCRSVFFPVSILFWARSQGRVDRGPNSNKLRDSSSLRDKFVLYSDSIASFRNQSA